MALGQITPVSKHRSVMGSDYMECPESEATHWYIYVGFDGKDGHLILPSRDAAEACMKHFVSPFERGTIGEYAGERPA